MYSFWLFLVLPFVAAAPTASTVSTVTIQSIITTVCDIPILKEFHVIQTFCTKQLSVPSISVSNPVGFNTTGGVVRYSVKYATAARWGAPAISTVWTPSIASNPTSLPLACPQTGLDISQVSEDCLDVVLYVPPTAKTTSGGVPTIAWIHGGSFLTGSASDPALDGSNLAIATNSIVAIVQYRLGTLGLLPPSSTSTNDNLAIQDLITALTFLHGVLPYFGGTAGTPQLTLAGQSSGANLIRGLLGTPTALPLFNNAWLHSDPLDYGFLTPGALSTLRGAWVSELNCVSASGCAQTMDLNDLLNHQNNLVGNATGLGPEFYMAQPIRPSPDSTFLTSRFTSSSSFPSSSSLKPIVVTTVKDEAMPTINFFFDSPADPSNFIPFISLTLGPVRTATVASSSFYPVNDTDARTTLNVLGTDEIWRCSAYKLVRDWATHTSSSIQYSAVITQGITFPDNEAFPECLVPGTVCHEDDIQVVFGTGSTTSPLTPELQARYKAFVRTSNPNASGFKNWPAASSSDPKTINLGGTAAIDIGGCVPSFWGQQVEFDYQVNNE
ncbi:hypothetical protein M422DRAFT_47374 [Sphaerobolus stellatus SS14]|uniref:Carboxylesterase type B domain-containing protein n=1 Tax=Sphaerobolus stellatus (strain SS14) TaxID=990650 RepID=A0A0C9VPX2_SPHS4|nr:hypothetical protein M422DRAFT_47374 [Sphaerobolus stellatus SS14]